MDVERRTGVTKVEIKVEIKVETKKAVTGARVGFRGVFFCPLRRHTLQWWRLVGEASPGGK